MDSVHGWWTTAGSHGPPWTGDGTDTRMPGRGGALTRAGPSTATENESSPAGVEKGEGSTRIPSPASLGLGR
jgi:hypothetical protein